MDVKRNSILELARRYDYDVDHSHQVECLAGTLFMELRTLHELTREDRKLLEYAAILHDIGGYVSSRGHHRHTLQMIMMEPLLEFSRTEKTLIANIARYHRKALPRVEHTAYGILSEEDKRRVHLLAPLLRLADALDRSHRGVVQELCCEISEEVVLISVGSESEIPVETEALARKVDMFQQVYRREVQLRVTRPHHPVPPVEAAFAFEGAA